jgi:hypothetical protein
MGDNNDFLVRSHSAMASPVTIQELKIKKFTPIYLQVIKSGIKTIVTIVLKYELSTKEHQENK